MVPFPQIDPVRRLALLEPPTGPVEMVLDTDAYNEIDDQFALVYALLSSKLRVEAVYAAPFSNPRTTPAEGMEQSHEEILRILERLGISPEGLVHRGSTRYLPSRFEPVQSPAATDLVARAMAPRPAPLYVLAIGAITNVASALLIEPRIAERVVVVWLGGNPYYWHTASEYNLQQDVPGAQVLFDCGVPVVHIPCVNVAEHMRTTLLELQAYVRGRGPIGDYLYGIFEAHHDDHFAYSKVIWDVTTVAWVNRAEWVPTDVTPSPILRDDLTWAPTDASRHLSRVARTVNRDAIFRDLFTKIEARARG